MPMENPWSKSEPNKKEDNQNWLPKYMESYEELTGEEFLTQMERHINPLTEEDLQKVVEDLEKKNPEKKKNLALSMIKKYGMIFLVAAAWAKPAKEILMPYSYYESNDNQEIKFKDKIDSGLTEGTVVLPEVSIFGHRDNKTDEILNYMTGKGELSQDMLNELTKLNLLTNLGSIRNYTVQKHNCIPSKIDDWQQEILSIPPENIVNFLQSDRAEKYLRDLVALEDVNWSDSYEENFFDLPDIEQSKKLIEIKKSKLEKEIYHLETVAEQDISKKQLNEFMLSFAKDQKVQIDAVSTDPELFPKWLKAVYGDSFLRPITLKKFQDLNVKEYKTMWEMHQRHGNPKIDLKPNTSVRTYQRAYYNIIENKIYLPTYAEYNASTDQDGQSFGFNDWVAELAHSKQFTEKPFLSNIKDLYSNFLVLRKSKESGKPYGQVYDEIEYERKGSIEYEAHSVIEKRLIQEYIDRIENE